MQQDRLQDTICTTTVRKMQDYNMVLRRTSSDRTIARRAQDVKQARHQCGGRQYNDASSDVGRTQDSLTKIGRKLDGSLTNVGRTSDRRRMQLRRTSDESRKKVRQTLDGNRTKVQRTLDELSSIAAAAMAGGGATLQLLATQCCGEAGRMLQLAPMARPVERCSSLMWRDRQRVATRCYGNGQQRCNSRHWAGSAATRGAGLATLQLAAMADRAVQPWPTLRCNVFVLFFIFIFYSTTSRAKERERQKEKGRESL